MWNMKVIYNTAVWIVVLMRVLKQDFENTKACSVAVNLREPWPRLVSSQLAFHVLLALAQTHTALRHASAADVAKQRINYSSDNQFQPPPASRVLLLTLEPRTLLSEELKEQLKTSNHHLLVPIFKQVPLLAP